MTLRRASRYALSLALLLLAACRAGEPGEAETGDEAAETPAATTSAAPAPVEVVAVDYSFQAPDSIPSGWTTFRLENRGREPHFFILWRLPEGRTLDDYGSAVGPAFAEAYGALEAGGSKAEAFALLAGLLPEWYAEVVAMGGVGMLSPDEAARATLKLEPGTYVMECYVKTPEGRFHVELGMARTLVVTDAVADVVPPEADAEITLGDDGIAAPAEVPAGERTFAVRFAAHPEVGLGNDVHVVRLEEEMTADAVVPWMDWMNLDGLRAPAPATFVGGAEEMPVGHTAYFTVDLAPGRYAWIGEAPEEASRTRPFVVE